MLPIIDQSGLGRRVGTRASTDSIGVVIVGHGSRDAQANAHFEELAARFCDRHSELDVSFGYIEIASPSLEDALSRCASRNTHVVAAPLFLFSAGHLKNDVPLALASMRKRYPGVVFSASRELGVHAALIDLAFQRTQPFLGKQNATTRTAVLIVGRGSSDPDANGDFCKFVRMVGEGRNFTWTLPCFIGITRPSFQEGAELVARSRPDRILVVPYFLFPGRLYEKLRDQVAQFALRNSWIRVELTPCLGADQKVLQVLRERVREVIEGKSPLPCDTCHYRAPLAGITENVSGMRALLWSLRHAYTHTQAVPHVHAHKPLTKHVLICGNADCAERGSIALIGNVRRALRKAQREVDIRVTRTGCMGRCGEGPTVAVYPDGIWYRGMQAEDAGELVEQHLLHDRIVSRLVDSILQ